MTITTLLTWVGAIATISDITQCNSGPAVDFVVDRTTENTTDIECGIEYSENPNNNRLIQYQYITVIFGANYTGLDDLDITVSIPLADGGSKMLPYTGVATEDNREGIKFRWDLSLWSQMGKELVDVNTETSVVLYRTKANLDFYNLCQGELMKELSFVYHIQFDPNVEASTAITGTTIRDTIDCNECTNSYNFESSIVIYTDDSYTTVQDAEHSYTLGDTVYGIMFTERTDFDWEVKLIDAFQMDSKGETYESIFGSLDFTYTETDDGYIIYFSATILYSEDMIIILKGELQPPPDFRRRQLDGDTQASINHPSASASATIRMKSNSSNNNDEDDSLLIKYIVAGAVGGGLLVVLGCLLLHKSKVKKCCCSRRNQNPRGYQVPAQRA